MILKPGAIALWEIFLGDIESCDCLENYLSSEENKHATEFKDTKLATRYRIAHAALRLILSQFINIPGQKILFEHTHNGKPLIAASQNSSLKFNLSHSHERALVGICINNEIGVDIEHIRPVPNMLSIAQRYFHPSENITAMTSERFFKLWTAKEAYVKAQGFSLFHHLSKTNTKATHVDVGPEYKAAYKIMGPSPSQVHWGHACISQKQLILVPHKIHRSHAHQKSI